jgi:large subunit ribosomal protein L25
MAHETPTITAERRERVGTRYARRLRKAGRLPAVIYGHNIEPVAVHVDEKDMMYHLRHGSHVVELKVDGGKTETCLVKDLQYGYLGDDVVHVDFTRVNLQEEVTVHVHLNFVGTAAEAHHAGAIVKHDLTELAVRCKVSDIPEELKVDLAKMDGTVLNAREVELPSELELAEDPDAVVCSIAFVKRQVAVGEETELEAAEGEPELISEAGEEGEGETAEAAEQSDEGKAES